MSQESQEDAFVCSICGREVIVGGDNDYKCNDCDEMCCGSCIVTLVDSEHDDIDEFKVCTACYSASECEVCGKTEDEHKGILANCKLCRNLCCRECIKGETCNTCINNSQENKAK